MPASSAGILLYRIASGDRLEVLLVHPGGPFFARRDDGAWSVPKGLVEEGEGDLDAARREFVEETGFALPDGPCLELGEVRLPSGKRVRAWAVEGDCDPERLASGTFELEWPPRSGARRSFPEVDRAGWFAPEAARVKLAPAQHALLERLAAALVQRGRIPAE